MHGTLPSERILEFQTAINLAHEARLLSQACVPSDTAELARYPIGKTIVRKAGRKRISSRIVEIEAYPPGDRSGHAYSRSRQTYPRNRDSMDSSRVLRRARKP